MNNSTNITAGILGLALIGLVGFVLLNGTESGSRGSSASQSSTKGPSGSSNTLNASHILVMHKQSDRAPANISRSKEEALERIKEAAEKVAKGDVAFSDLAKIYSDCPSSADGGKLGNFEPHAMVPKFSTKTQELDVGEISEPIETQFGYHIILRNELD